MFAPTELKICGTCTDLKSLVEVFEAVHRLALSYAPHLDRASMEREFNVSVTFTRSGSTVQVLPVESDEWSLGL